MEICNKCLWEYDEYDLYCSGCARDINSVDIKPVFDNNEIIIYPETKKIPLILSNTGLKGAITLTGIKANKDKVENTDNTLDLHSSRENSPAREKNLDILLKNLIAGEKFNISLENDSNLDLKYLVNVIPSPQIKIFFDDKEIIDNNVFTDSEKENFTISIVSVSKILLKNVSVNDIALSAELLNEYRTKFEFNLPKSDIENGKLLLNIDALCLENLSFNIKVNFISKNGLISSECSDLFIGNRAIKIGSKAKELSIICSLNPFIEVIEDPYIDAEYSEVFKYKQLDKSKDGNFIFTFEILPMNIPKGRTEPYKIPITINYIQNQINYSNTFPVYVTFEVTELEYLKSVFVIDFGTTNSSVSWVEDESIKILNFKEQEENSKPPTKETLPTLLFFYDYMKDRCFEENKVISDSERYNNLFDMGHFEHLAWGWKKYFGTNKETKLLDSNGNLLNFNSIQLTKIYLEKIINHFVNYEEKIPTEFAFTYPASYEHKKNDLVEAMKLVKIQSNTINTENIQLKLNESNAITYYLASNKNNKYSFLKQNQEPVTFAVFDFGGGTTDITVAKMINIPKTSSYGADGFPIEIPEKTILEVLDSAGPPKMGGDYLDFELALLIKETVEKKATVKIPFPQNLDEAFERKFSKNLSKQEIDKILKNFCHAMDKARNDIKHKYSDFKLNQNISNLNFYTEDSNGNYSEKSCIYEVVFQKEVEDKIEEFVLNQIDFLKLIIENLAIIKKLEKSSIQYIILCGNGSKLQVLKEIFERNFKDFNTEIIVSDEEDAKLAVVKGACGYYNTTPSFELTGLNNLYVTLGYEIDGKFKTFLNTNMVRSGRGITLEYFKITDDAISNLEISELDNKMYYLRDLLNKTFSLKDFEKELSILKLSKKEENSIKECTTASSVFVSSEPKPISGEPFKIYYSHLPPEKILDQRILDNKDIFPAGEINLSPYELKDKEVRMKIHLNKNFPYIDCDIEKRDARSNKLFERHSTYPLYLKTEGIRK